MKHFISIVGRYVGELHTASSTLAVEEVIDNSSYVVVVLLQQLLFQVAIRDFHAHQPIHEVSGFFRRCPLCLWRYGTFSKKLNVLRAYPYPYFNRT